MERKTGGIATSRAVLYTLSKDGIYQDGTYG